MDIVPSGDAQQPRLLFVSQVTPALTGDSSMMRAGALLSAFAQHYRVTLLLVPPAGQPPEPLAPELAAAIERLVWPRSGTPLSSEERFDVVHVSRLESAPAAAPWLATTGRRQIDLGPLPSRRAHRLTRLARTLGHLDDVDRWNAVEQQAILAEDAALASYGRVFVTWAGDQQTLQARDPSPAEVIVLPETLPVPDTTLFPPPTRGDYTLLFVGDLGTEENTDAMQHFCTAILPRIQAGANRPVRLRIVGEGAGPTLQRLAGQAGVELVGPVPELDPWYRDAHAVVVPLRAGAGPHLKAIEALAFGRPLVASDVGVEGLELEHGVHAMLADDPAPFATATVRLLHIPALAQHVSEAGHQRFVERYARPVLERIVATQD